MGGEFFQPDLVVVVQAGLVVIDEHRSGNVHGVYRVRKLKVCISALRGSFDCYFYGSGETNCMGYRIKYSNL
jgi:hypothetical protein